MRFETHEPLGATLHDADLGELTDTDRERLRSCLADHGVVVARDQWLDDAEFSRFLSDIGELTFTSGEVAVPGHPLLNVVTNEGRTSPPVSNWHVDTGYIDRPPSYTALRAVVTPTEGGATLFTNQQRALEQLPDALVRRIAGRTMTHVVTGVEPGAGEQSAADHPLIRPHPRTGRGALWLDAPKRCSSISGLDGAASRKLADELLSHSTTPDLIWRHVWEPGDVVIWDNAVVMHRADHSAVHGTRTFHRGLVSETGYGVQ